jgi:hypothetical protein
MRLTAHELARKLLDGPDYSVLINTSLDFTIDAGQVNTDGPHEFEGQTIVVLTNAVMLDVIPIGRMSELGDILQGSQTLNGS